MKYVWASYRYWVNSLGLYQSINQFKQLKMLNNLIVISINISCIFFNLCFQQLRLTFLDFRLAGWSRSQLWQMKTNCAELFYPAPHFRLEPHNFLQFMTSRKKIALFLTSFIYWIFIQVLTSDINLFYSSCYHHGVFWRHFMATLELDLKSLPTPCIVSSVPSATSVDAWPSHGTSTMPKKKPAQ